MRVRAYGLPDTVLQLVNSKEGAFETEIILSCQNKQALLDDLLAEDKDTLPSDFTLRIPP